MLDAKLHQKFETCSDLIKKSNNILIVTHEDPDPDAIGGVLALGLALEKLKKKIQIFCSDPLPEYMKFLPQSELVSNKFSKHNIDLIIGLDYGDWKRTGVTYEWPVIIITLDHHLQSNQIGDIKIVDSRFSSTCEIIYWLFKVMGLGLDKNIATCLLAGIFADTGGFQHANTTERALKVAGELLLKGAMIYKIAGHLSQNKNLASLKVCGLALSRIKKDPQTGMVVSIVSQADLLKCQATSEDLSGVSAILNSVSGGKFSLFLTEYEKNKIKGSLRSEKYKGADVSQIAKALGGGGHKLAAAFKLEGSLEEVLDRVKEAVNNQNF